VTFIFRGGLPLAVPETYATDPAHVALVEILTRLSTYRHVVAFLELHPTDGWLAVEVLSGAGWAKRYLNTTAKLWGGSPAERALATRGWRALMHLLNGTKPRVGRHKAPPLHPEALGAAALVVAHWRGVVEAHWAAERDTLTAALLKEAESRFRVSAAHRRATRALVRRRGIRKRDVVLAFASWETGVPVRRLRVATTVADLVYA
jgi:hypothetical protein